MKRKDFITRYSIIERIIFIDEIVRSGGMPNATNLSETLEVSTATIKRDIEFMRDRLRAPLEYDPYEHGYFYTKDFDLRKKL